MGEWCALELVARNPLQDALELDRLEGHERAAASRPRL